MQSHLDSLQVKVVVPDGFGVNGKPEPIDTTALKKKLKDEGDESSGDGMTVTSPVAFPMLPIDRYGFLITDKYVLVFME